MKILQFERYDGGFWFRLFGRGLSIVDKVKHPPLFSERHGYRTVVRMGRFGFEYLRPWKQFSSDGKPNVIPWR